MEFSKYIKAVGTGPKGNRDLSFDESKDMMTQILNQSVHGEQIAAFLLGWRLKPETVEEFRGSLSACDSFVKQEQIKNSIELGYPFDGKAKHPYIFPLVAKILEDTALNLVVMGDAMQPAKNGITIKDICTKIELSKNTHYFDRADFCKELHNLTDIRNRLGVRSGFNTIEKLPNVAKSEYAITGVFHKPYVEKYMKIFSDRYKRFALIKGNEGTPELFTKGNIWISEGEKMEELIVDPAFYGVNIEKSLQMISLEDSLEALQNPSEELLKLARLNAAILLFVSEKAKNIDEAYEKLGG